MNDAKTALGHKILAIKQQRRLSWKNIAYRLGYSTPRRPRRRPARWSALPTTRWRCCRQSRIADRCLARSRPDEISTTSARSVGLSGRVTAGFTVFPTRSVGKFYIIFGAKRLVP